MSSVISSFEYDIFISYRQKDNKGDRWVSEFVDALKDELESTFKEEVSVYFDINPHDGLLETHNVDASLKEKLKCLVFIPIISQTFCDPKSYAWQHEFCAFNQLAKEDQFGRDIKLSNGNVASRILPVKIHDLDQTDKTLLENELASVLRSVDFIYKSSGVNRPLKPDDSRTENLNHTFYRDQINKVANAVKEIITSLKHPDDWHKATTGNQVHSDYSGKSSKKLKFKIAVWTFLIVIIAVSFYLLIPVLSETSTGDTDKSIAVLPFENLSNDPEQEYFSDGMMEEILNHLYKIGDLKVASRTSSMNYKGSKKTINEIGRELGVAYVLEGSIRKYGYRLRIQTKLICAKTDQNVIWAEDYDREITIANILDIQSEVAQQVAIKLKAKINPEVKLSIETHFTNNRSAYDLYLKGLQNEKQFWKEERTLSLIDTAMQYYLKSIGLDPQFSMAYKGLGKSYWTLAHLSPNHTAAQWLESERALKRAIELDPTNGQAYANYAFVQSTWEWDKEGAERSIENAIRLMPGDIEIRIHAFKYFIRSRQCEKARKEYDQMLKMNPEMLKYGDDLVWLSLCEGKVGGKNNFSTRELKSLKVDSLNLTNVYIIEKQYSKAITIAESCSKMEEVFSLNYLTFYGVGTALAGETNKALNTIKKMEEISAYRNVPYTFFAQIYLALGDEKKSYEFLEKALAVHEMWIHDMIRYAPFYDLRNDPKFLKIIERSWIPWQSTE